MTFETTPARSLVVAMAAALGAACGQGEVVANPQSVPAQASFDAVSREAPEMAEPVSMAPPADAGAYIGTNAGAAAEATAFDHPLGFALSLPQGWTAMDAGDGQYRFTLPDARANEAVALTAARLERSFSATDADAIQATEQEISRQYPQLQRRGAPQLLRTQAGDAVRLDWTGQTPDGAQARLSVYLASLDNVAVSLIAAGMADDFAARRSEVESMFATLRRSAGRAALAPTLPPAGAPGELHDGSAVARDWAERLSGKKLTVLSGYTSSGQSGGMNSRYDLVLGRDGSYAYSGSSSVSMSAGDFGGSSVSQESGEGTWRIITQGVAAVLELTTENGKQYGELTRRGSETYMSGTRVFVTDP